MPRLLEWFVQTTFFKWIAYTYFWILFSTYKFSISTPRGLSVDDVLDEAVGYMWHEDVALSMMFLYHTKQVGHFVVNSSPEGKFAAFFAKKLGFKVLYGASKPSFIRSALDVLDMNKRLFIVGDSLKNSAKRINKELPYLSAKSDVPLVHIKCRSTSSLSLTHLDKLSLPLPFSTIYITLSKPQKCYFDDNHNAVIKGA